MPGQRDPLGSIRIVLVRPQGAANIGAVARAMKNLGVRELALVGTSQRRLESAKRTAVHAADVLDGALRPRSLEEAVADCTLVVGTSGQGGMYRDAPEVPEEIAPDLLAAAERGRVAVVFGPEHHGLTREDLRCCARLVCIETAEDYTSLNLAQAVLVVCYELRRQSRSRDGAGGRAAAAAVDLDRLEQKMRRAMLEMGFLNPQNPDRILFVLRRMVGRAVVRPLEARVLLALAGQMEWCARAATAARRAGILAPRADQGGADDR